MSDRHQGPLMPETTDREFAYEDEYVSRPAAVITAHHNRRRGVKPVNDADAGHQLGAPGTPCDSLTNDDLDEIPSLTDVQADSLRDGGKGDAEMDAVIAEATQALRKAKRQKMRENVCRSIQTAERYQASKRKYHDD